MCVHDGEVCLKFRVGSLFDLVGSGSQNQTVSKASVASTFTCWSIWLIHASIFITSFSLEKVVFRLWFKKNYTWPHPYYMHNQMISTCILRIINPPHSIFSISLPCQLPKPFPVSYYKFRMHAESDTKSASNICPSSTNILVPPHTI